MKTGLVFTNAGSEFRVLAFIESKQENLALLIRHDECSLQHEIYPSNVKGITLGLSVITLRIFTMPLQILTNEQKFYTKLLNFQCTIRSVSALLFLLLARSFRIEQCTDNTKQQTNL